MRACILHRRPADPCVQDSLARMKRWPSLIARWRGKVVRIYNASRGLYWRPESAGYTQDPREAGLYAFERAYAITCHCGPEVRIEFQLVTKWDPHTNIEPEAMPALP